MSDINNTQLTERLINNDITNNNNSNNNYIDSVIYHSPNTVSDTGKTLNNKKHGIWKRYDKDGNITMKCEYNNGVKHGECIYFQTRNGITYTYEKGKYFNNKEVGWWKQYNSKGEIVYAEYIDDN